MVRHGETQWNVESRIQGQGDSPLTASGLEQAEAIAGRLSSERFDVLVASDLGRAMQTAAAIARRCGHSIIPDPRLREAFAAHAWAIEAWDDVGHLPGAVPFVES